MLIIDNETGELLSELIIPQQYGRTFAATHQQLIEAWAMQEREHKWRIAAEREVAALRAARAVAGESSHAA